MNSKNNDKDAFSEDYAIPSTTDAPDNTGEGLKKDETVTEQMMHYDKSKPYRVIIKAKEIE